VIAVQRELKSEQIPMGTTVIVFAQSLSVSLWVAVAQPVFESKLRGFLQSSGSGIDTDKVIHAGVGALDSVATLEQLPTLKAAYNYACTQVFVSLV
jgi:hypothetical protein